MAVSHKDLDTTKIKDVPSTSEGSKTNSSVGKQLWKGILKNVVTSKPNNMEGDSKSKSFQPDSKTKLKQKMTSPSHLVVQVQPMKSHSKLSLQDLDKMEANMSEEDVPSSKKPVGKNIL